MFINLLSGPVAITTQLVLAALGAVGLHPSVWALNLCTLAAFGPQHPGPEEAAGLQLTLPVSSDLLSPELRAKKT